MSLTPTATVQSLPNDFTAGPDNELLVNSGVLGLGPVGAQRVIGNRAVCNQMWDFNGYTVAYSTTPNEGWISRVGTTDTTNWTVTDAVNGTIVGAIGDTTASMAVSGIQLSRGLSWKANQGGLYCEWRVKTGIITDISIFVGLTDQSAALEMPVSLSTTTFTYNAADAVGFLFDTAATTDTIRLVGVAATTGATAQDTSLAYVADTYRTLRVELSTTGVATFYIDGVQVGTAMTGAVTATVALTPVVAAFNRTTANGVTAIVTADYCDIGALRA
jgi:hypothetical protein